MRVFLSIICVILAITSCSPTDNKRSTDTVERDLTVNVATEIGQDFGEGLLRLSKVNEILTLSSSRFSQSGIVPDAMRVLFHNIAALYEGEMFQFPLTVGKTWEYHWDGRAQITIEALETVEIAAGTFPQCLKHTTVVTVAYLGTELEKGLRNGIRYLWFAKGIVLVKMR